MSRNSKKFQKQEHPSKQNSENENLEGQEPQPLPPQAETKPKFDNPFGLSFVVPTEFVDLPTAGEFYPNSSPLSGVEKVEIKHMTAKEEDLLSTTSAEDGDTIFDKLIDNLLVDPQLSSDMFCEEDKMAILLSARISGYGPEYTVSEYCQGCQNTAEHNYSLLEKQFVHEKYHDLEYIQESNIFKITTPVSKLSVQMINFSDEDREHLQKVKKQKEKHNLEYNSTIEFLKLSIISVEGETDKKTLMKLYGVLPAADASVLKSVYENAKPKVSTMQEVKCSECGFSSSKEVPFSLGWFWSK